jgi:hypothetical protein
MLILSSINDIGPHFCGISFHGDSEKYNCERKNISFFSIKRILSSRNLGSSIHLSTTFLTYSLIISLSIIKSTNLYLKVLIYKDIFQLEIKVGITLFVNICESSIDLAEPISHPLFFKKNNVFQVVKKIDMHII